jgi:formamidopyrimidine-DNA glycosylase
MPESPEVQALVDFLAPRVVRRAVQSIDIVFPRALKSGDPAALVGGRITGIMRRGKLIDLVVGGEAGTAPHDLIVHWGHDGWVVWHESVPDGLRRSGDATLMARLRLDDGSGFDLTDSGQWKALAIFVVPSPGTVPAVAKLGPDPTDPAFSRDELRAIVGGRRKQLKALLQDQGAIAGIGNAYSDEILHAAKLSPVVHASSLTEEDTDRLYDAMRSILTSATRARSGLPPELLKDDKRANMRVHRRLGHACPVCGDVVRGITFSGAAAHYCATCQTGGVVLA